MLKGSTEIEKGPAELLVIMLFARYRRGKMNTEGGKTSVSRPFITTCFMSFSFLQTILAT